MPKIELITYPNGKPAVEASSENIKITLFGFKENKWLIRFHVLLSCPKVLIPGFRILNGNILPPQSDTDKKHVYSHFFAGNEFRELIYAGVQSYLTSVGKNDILNVYEDATRKFRLTSSGLNNL